MLTQSIIFFSTSWWASLSAAQKDFCHRYLGWQISPGQETDIHTAAAYQKRDEMHNHSDWPPAEMRKI